MDKIKQGKRLAGRFVPARYGGSAAYLRAKAPPLSYSCDGKRKMDFVGLWARMRAYVGF